MVGDTFGSYLIAIKIYSVNKKIHAKFIQIMIQEGALSKIASKSNLISIRARWVVCCCT